MSKGRVVSTWRCRHVGRALTHVPLAEVWGRRVRRVAMDTGQRRMAERR